jgi:hypothetical protein
MYRLSNVSLNAEAATSDNFVEIDVSKWLLMYLFQFRPLLSVLILILSASLPVSAQVLPEYPHTGDFDTCFPDTTGYRRITVGPVGRDYIGLTEAIEAAPLGSVLLLDPVIIHRGTLTLPDKGQGEGWIIIMAARMDVLPSEAQRIEPTRPTGDPQFPVQSDAMPKLRASSDAGLETAVRAHHYRLVGLEIYVNPIVNANYGVVNLGDGSSAQNTLEKVPHHLILDRCYIHGHDQGTIMKYGVRLDAAYAAVVDCHISNFHSDGFDTQAIGGINGPGPFKILNNYLEAAGENILFGGGAPRIPGLVPSDIEIRQNHFYKPWSWRVGHPEYAGRHWTVKNHFELKTGRRVWLDGNVLENCWADLPIGQSGYSILLTVRTEGGQSPQADVSDIIITNNIIRHVGAGISISGTDGAGSNRSARILVQNNLFEDIAGSQYGDLNIFGPNDGTFLKIGEPRDVWIDHNTIFQNGPVTWAYDTTAGFAFTNNITQAIESAGGYQGIYGPGQAQGNGTFARYFPDVTDAGRQFDGNVLIYTEAFHYSNFSTQSQNAFPENLEAVGFIDEANGWTDYHLYALSPSSPYAGFGTGARDPGVDMVELDSAFFAERDCVTQTTRVGGPRSDAPGVCRVSPNPASDVIFPNTSADNMTYVIADMLGRLRLAGRVRDTTQGIAVDLLEPGTYLMRLTGNRHGEACLFVIR